MSTKLLLIHENAFRNPKFYANQFCRPQQHFRAFDGTECRPVGLRLFRLRHHNAHQRLIRTWTLSHNLTRKFRIRSKKPLEILNSLCLYSKNVKFWFFSQNNLTRPVAQKNFEGGTKGGGDFLRPRGFLIFLKFSEKFPSKNFYEGPLWFFRLDISHFTGANSPLPMPPG